MKGRKRKTGRKILAVVLSVCMLFTASPNLWDAVMVQAAETVQSGTDAMIQALRDRIVVLPGVEEYLATELDMDDEETYAQWEEKLYAYAEETLAIWEEYETLTEQKQAQIPEDVLAKLTAWVEISETLLDHAVMLADDSEHHGESDWTALTAGDTTLSKGKYYLSSDITMDTITVTGNVTLCLNGHTLTHDNSADGSVIVVESGTFILCDCQDNYTYSWNDSKENPVYTLRGSGGCITGGNGYNSQGGGVHVKANATFVMNSGRITECNVGTDAGHNGGGVYVATDAIFEMTGGFIENNAAGSGGGVCVEGCFSMSDEAVIMNNASSGGGGVGITSGSGSFTMRGGKIIGNTVSGLGGGVRGYLRATISMEGGLIEGNSAKDGGGGLNIPTNSPTKLSGGTIRYNRMSGSVGLIDAGGVRLLGRTSTLELSGSISIYDNYYSDGTISNVFLPNNASVTITGPLTNSVGITSQTKPQNGSGDNGVVVANENTSEDYDYHCIVSDENYRVIKSGSQILLAEWTGNPVTITAYKDGLEWVENPPTYKLTSDNGTSFVTDLTAVPDGEYHVYEGDTATGVTVKVDGAAAEVRLDYYTVTFYDGDTELTTPTQQIVLKNQTASAPATDPTKTGYTFGKWVTADGGSTAYDFTKAVTSKTSVYASWTPVSYSITYILDGGTATGNPANYTIESGAITLKNPTRTGYSFTGWSGTDLTGNNNTSVTIGAGSTGNREYTAHWSAADYTVILHTNGGTGGTDLTSYTFGTGAVLPTDWQKTGYVFDGWYDNESCTGTAVTSISAADTGNKEYWAKWTDNIAPIIGTLSYNYQPKNFLHWLIGKDSLVITVPVTEEGSGADKITYTVTPDGGTAGIKTAAIKNGVAEITVSADFKGTISIVCTDKAGNTSAGVTVGAGLSANGIIIEDNAPEIAFQAENAELLPSGEYKIVPKIAVTVADDKNNAISGGIASVSYQINGGSAKTVPHDYMTSMVVNDSFTIQTDEITASGIPADGAVISVTVTDNAGNSTTDTYTVKVHTHSETLVPAVDPTCTTAGNEQHYTCFCGKWFSDSGCTNEITDKSSVVIDALGHDFAGEEYMFDKDNHWKKCSRCPETDLEEAHKFETDGIHCTVCDYEKAGEGHIHSGELHGAIEPTCTTAGNIAYYTCHCGSWFSDSGCTDEIIDKLKIEIEALGHDFEMKNDQNEHWQQCSRCHLEQSREPHAYDNDTDTECNECGYVRTIQHTHNGTFVPAKPATCTEDGNQAYYICTCGKWFTDSGCTAEVTEQGVVIAAKGHDFSGEYQHDEKDHWKKCNRCEETQSKAEHSYDNDMDRDCNVCGYQRAIENPPGETGAVSKDVEKDEKAPDTVLSTSAEELADIILTEEEKAQIENGINIKFILDVKDAEDTVNSSDKAAVQEALSGDTEAKGFAVGQYLDISLFKVIGADRSAISQTSKKLTIVIDVPDSLRGKDSTKPRTYAIIRVHNGQAEWLADLDDNTDTITIATDRFSAYAIVYKEAGSGTDVTPSPTPGGKDDVTPAPSPTGKPEKASGKEKRKIEIHSGLKAIQTGKKLQISWGRVSGADGYSVYVQYCGKEFSAKSLNQVRSGKKTKITVKKVNGKKLDTTKNFKLYVVAWQWKNGKKSSLAKTLTIHVAGRDNVKYTNVKKIQVKKTSYMLKKGGTVTLRPGAVLYDKRKKQLSADHTKEFRYLSSNKKIATVTAGGKVKAKGTGECIIYVFAKNGCRRKIKIKVKK